MPGKVRSLALLALCNLAAVSLWFAASAVVPSLRVEYGLSPGEAAAITSSVQLGFVAGTLLSAIFGCADRFDLRRFFMVSALLAAAGNAAVLWLEPPSPLLLAARFLTGACMAGVYPVSTKIATTWARRDLGLLVGILIGALTLGFAAPHLFNAFGGTDWRFTIRATSIAAAASAFLIHFVSIGPALGKSPPFRPAAVLEAWRNRSLRYANLGYFGHNWELFGMWTWLGAFLEASFRLSPGGAEAPMWARLASFVAIGLGGAVGCVLGGLFADRFGRTTLTIGALVVSGACTVAVGPLFGGPAWLLTLVCVVWGAAVIADSAQYSASIAELSDLNLVGTMLTVQICLGFLVTLVTIEALPRLVDLLGWTYAFLALTPGCLFGIWAMRRLRALPEADRLAGGRR